MRRSTACTRLETHLDEVRLVERSGDFVWVWMNRPERRNALSLDHLAELRRRLRRGRRVRRPRCGPRRQGPGVLRRSRLRATSPAPTSPTVRTLLETCTDLLDTMQAIPQAGRRPRARARHRGRVPARGDVRPRRGGRDRPGSPRPGGKGGWFCHTPMVAIGRNVGAQARARARAHGRHRSTPRPRRTGVS